MAVALYVCAIILVRMVGQRAMEGEDGVDDFWEDHYGSVFSSMFTLFQLMMQPNLLEYRSRLGTFPIITAFLVVFIIFGSFGMIALLTGVISEAMFQKNQVKIQEERQERKSTRKALLQNC